MPTYLIDQILPQTYLINLGRYVQTCALVEHAICLAICHIERLSMESDAGKTRHDQLRLLATKDLISQLSKAGKRCEYDYRKEYFKKLSAWLHQTIETRHLAIHGRHFFENSKLKIAAPLKKGRAERIQSISNKDVKDALNKANSVLMVLHKFLRVFPDQAL